MSDETVVRDYISIDRDVKVLQPDWANPPTVKDLKQDLSEALPSHNLHVAKVNEWVTALRGELKIKTAEGRSKVQPKVIRKQAEWRYASLEEPFLSTEDMFKVNPVTYKDVDAAKQNAMILNKQFRVDIPKVEFINKYIRAAVNTGTVIIKLSWESETDVVLDEVPVYTSTPEELYQVLQQMVASGQMTEEEAVPIMQAGEPIEIGVESKLVEKEIINRPVLEVKDSRNVIIDPSCEGDIRKAQFIVDKFLTDLSALKKDGRYSNLDKIQERDYDAPDMTYYDEWKDDPNFRFQDKPRKKLMAYEYWGYWDINNDGIVKPFVATWVGDVMIRLEENPYPDKQLPYVLVQYLPPDGNTLYGDADASLLKDNQDIIGAVSRSMIDLIGRSANAQQGIRKDLLDPINADRFKKGLDFEYNPVSNVGDALYTTKIPEIPRSALEMIQLQNNEAEAITGVKAFSGGITSQALGDMLDLETDVPLYNGSFKKVKELELGDKLIGLNGLATTITKLFAIDYPKTAYKLTFSNGATVVVGGEHKWSVKVWNKECKYGKNYKTLDTDTIVSYFDKGEGVYIPRIKRIDMNGEYPDVDPYCIGFWLGDGNSYTTSITTKDEEVLDRFRKYYNVTIDKNASGIAYYIRSKMPSSRDSVTGRMLPNINSFEYHLRTLNLMKTYGGEKHIPEQYFNAPYNIKLELLRGLMDADGYAHSGSFNVFTQSESRLKNDVIRLLKSMGIKCSISKHITSKDFNDYKRSKSSLPIISRNDMFEIGFSCVDNPFYITRKANKYKSPKQINTHKLVSVEKVSKVLMRCLEVDSPDHLFAITEDYILTHNSVGGIRSALDATAKRELGILRRLSNGLKKIGMKIISMNQAWLADEEILRITDEDFIAIKRSDLAGSFDLTLDVSTAEADNQKASELAFMLQTIGQTVPYDITKLILSKIADLRKLPDLSRAISEFTPQPDPMVVEQQKLQIELLKAQVQNEYAKAAENEIDRELKAAKAQNELAKAGKVLSEKDKLDLDYVEQASGLTQERELESQLMGLQFKDRLSKQKD